MLVWWTIWKKIKCIRSDNGTEFCLQNFFKSKGILHQLTCVNTPQQNLIAEKKNQHILNVARALMFQFQIPLSYCDDCVLIAMYLINRTPSKILHNKTLLKCFSISLLLLLTWDVLVVFVLFLLSHIIDTNLHLELEDVFS